MARRNIRSIGWRRLCSAPQLGTLPIQCMAWRRLQRRSRTRCEGLSRPYRAWSAILVVGPNAGLHPSRLGEGSPVNQSCCICHYRRSSPRSLHAQLRPGAAYLSSRPRAPRNHGGEASCWLIDRYILPSTPLNACMDARASHYFHRPLDPLSLLSRGKHVLRMYHHRSELHECARQTHRPDILREDERCGAICDLICMMGMLDCL